MCDARCAMLNEKYTHLQQSLQVQIIRKRSYEKWHFIFKWDYFIMLKCPCSGRVSVGDDLLRKIWNLNIFDRFSCVFYVKWKNFLNKFPISFILLLCSLNIFRFWTKWMVISGFFFLANFQLLCQKVCLLSREN